MLNKLLKSLTIMALLLTTLYAGNKKNSIDYQDEISKIKIELAKIKLIHKYENRDKKIIDIEKSIKDLESKFYTTVINTNNIEKDFQRYNELIKRQDARISDINSNVNADITQYSSIIGLLFLFVSLVSYKISSGENKKILKVWIDKKANEEFKPKVDAYLEQIEEKGIELLSEIKIEANKLNQEHKDEISKINLMHKELSDKDKKQIDSSIKELGDNEENYSYDDWYSKFIQQYYKPNYKQALIYIDKAIEIAKSDYEQSSSLVAKALTLGSLDRSEEEIVEYDKVIDRFSDSSNEEILVQVAKALNNKGAIFELMHRSEKAIVEYNKVIDRFSSSLNNNLLESVALALKNKVIVLVSLNRNEEAVVVCNKVIDKFRGSSNDNILKQVADTINNKIVALALLDRNDEVIEECDRLINNFSDSSNEKILDLVSGALNNKIEILLIDNQDISNDLKLIKKLFADNSSVMIQSSMLEILYNAKTESQDSEIKEWSEKYKEVSLGNWGFDELDSWNEAMDDGDAKDRIGKYIDIFRKFKEE